MKRLIKKIVPKKIVQKYHAYKKAKELDLFSGHNVKCPICNSEFGSFAMYGNRTNARCLNCESLERHRLIWKYLNERTDFYEKNRNGQKRLLHFAPEKVFYNIFSRDREIGYFPCDLHPENYKHVGEIDILKVDITNMPFNQ